MNHKKIILVFVLAAAVRMIMPIYILVSRDDPLRFMLSDYPGIVFGCALDIANGNGYPYIQEQMVMMTMVASKMLNVFLESIPLSVYLSLGGTDAHTALAVIQMMQGVVDALGCFIVYALLGLLGLKRMRLAAAVLYAFWLPSIFYAYHYLAEAYISVTVLAIGYTVAQGILREKWIYFALSGLLFAFLLLLRIDNFFVVPFILAYVLWYFRGRKWFAVSRVSVSVFILLAVYLSGMRAMVNALDISEPKIKIMKDEFYRKNPGHRDRHKAYINWFAISLYNMLAEYPPTYKGARIGNDWATAEYLSKRAEYYKNNPDGLYLFLKKNLKLDEAVLIGLKEVVLEKPVLYADRFIRRFAVYLPSHHYLACMAVFYTQPRYKYPGRPAHWAMEDYRYSQLYNGVKYLDYMLFAFFAAGVWTMRKHRLVPVFLCVYAGVLTGHALTFIGEFYFRVDKEVAMINPKYLIGMAAMWPLFIPAGAAGCCRKVLAWSGRHQTATGGNNENG